MPETKKNWTASEKQNVIDKLWLNYFNDTLFAKVDGVVRFERWGKYRKKVSVYPKAEAAAEAAE